MTQINNEQWQEFLQNRPDAHVLQSAQWGALKNEFGWNARYFERGDSGAQVLFRNLPLGFAIAYIPKGPTGVNNNELLEEIDQFCKSSNVILLKVEPDGWESEDRSEVGFSGFQSDPDETIQPRRTAIVSLLDSEDDILARMKQKTRYNIRLARRKGIVVEQSHDLNAFQKMVEVTGERDGFGVHSFDYYQRTLELFSEDKQGVLLIASFEGKPLAGLINLHRGKRAWYLHGASTNEERNRMPTYLLQWEAMCLAKKLGCEEYDLWGVPDHDHDFLEENFKERSDGLWGVYRFKRGFGIEVKRTPGSWIKVYKPLLYRAYQAYLRQRRGS